MTTSTFSQIGVIGLGTMGRNLALNLADQGVPLVVWERDRELAERARSDLGDRVTWASGPWDLAARLAPPRAVLLMVTAGAAVDSVLGELKPFLGARDVVVDGGNTEAGDTARRQQELEKSGIRLIGLGVSGGEEGARNGPALMAGGAVDAWERVAPQLTAIAARTTDGSACCQRLGAGASGHFVKTVHNGIEYAVMQVLAEAYDLMRNGLGLEVPAIADVFRNWNQGPSAGYLVEIAGDVVATQDPAGGPLLDRVVDRAGQKGTGRWASLAALDFGVPAPTIAEAVFARAVYARRSDRHALAASPPTATTISVDDLHGAVRATTLIAFLQGLDLIAAADRSAGWGVRLPDVARVWRAGCILRAALLDRLAAAYDALPPDASGLSAPDLRDDLAQTLPGLRRAIAGSVTAGFAVPAMTSALGWYDGMTRHRVPADFLQGLRDRFGAHGFERDDQPGTHHADWSGR